MYRSRRIWLVMLVALGAAGCIVVVEVPASPTVLPTPVVHTADPHSNATPRALPTAIAVSGSPTPAPPATETLAPAPAAASLTPGSAPLKTSVPISITSFTITPAEIRPGAPLTLTWNVAAEQVTIYQLDPQGRLSLPFEELPLSGTLVVTPSELLRNHVDFVLFANSGASSAQAFVSARIVCPDTWFFAQPPAACPQSPPHYTVMQAERFEHGLMLWTEWNRLIYILYADGRSPHWEVRPDQWSPGLPQDDPAIVPPPGLYQPVRGFGVAWRDEQALVGMRVRDRLGWAREPESGVGGAAYQCDSAPKYNTCYISGPENAVYVLQPERSGWYVWAGPTPAP